MSKTYSKKALTFEEQLAQLQTRGLKIDDHQNALNVISHINYYRLSAYWFPFRKRDETGQVSDNFIPGTSFEQAVRRYEFDRKLPYLY